jgi:hypothetical protein
MDNSHLVTGKETKSLRHDMLPLGYSIQFAYSYGLIQLSTGNEYSIQNVTLNWCPPLMVIIDMSI